MKPKRTRRPRYLSTIDVAPGKRIAVWKDEYGTIEYVPELHGSPVGCALSAAEAEEILHRAADRLLTATGREG